VVRAATERREELEQLPALQRAQAALLAVIERATTEQLMDAWHEASRIPGLWTPEHTAAAQARTAEVTR
jgi:hypothetical protein